MTKAEAVEMALKLIAYCEDRDNCVGCPFDGPENEEDTCRINQPNCRWDVVCPCCGKKP